MSTYKLGTCKVQLTEPGHRYFDADGQEYRSFSAFKAKYKKEFQREQRSLASAKKLVRESGEALSIENIREMQEQVKESWDGKRDKASAHGTNIHGIIENYDKTGAVPDERLRPHLVRITMPFHNHYRVFAEQTLWLDEYLIAGTVDKFGVRKNSSRSPIDITDYKTNLEKGIQFDSPYGNYLLPPIDYLEECNFNEYSLQLSTYAYMIEKTFGYRIGKLSITFIDPSWKETIIPVIYMRSTVIDLLEDYKERYLPEWIEQTKQKSTPPPASATDDDYEVVLPPLF